MNSGQTRRIFEFVNRFLILVAALVVVLLGALYLVVGLLLPPSSGGIGALIREFLTGICINLIPVFLIAVGSYFFLREYQSIKSDQETSDLAEKLSVIVRTAPPRELAPDLEVDILQGQLVITDGQYGADNDWTDVSAILKSMITGGRLELRGKYNQLFGHDPIEGTPKKLKVVYIHNGREVSLTVPEDTTLVLPVPLSWHVKGD